MGTGPTPPKKVPESGAGVENVEEKIPEVLENWVEDGFCLHCAHTPCLCAVLKLELKLEMLRLDNTWRNVKGEKSMVEQQDPQLYGDNAAQPGEEQMGQQLHQQNLGGGAAAPKGRGDNVSETEEEKPVWCRGVDHQKLRSLKPSDILVRERNSKRKWCENHMDETTEDRPKSKAKTTLATEKGAETTAIPAHKLKETTRPPWKGRNQDPPGTTSNSTANTASGREP